MHLAKLVLFRTSFVYWKMYHFVEQIKRHTNIPSGFQMCGVVDKNQHKIREVEKDKVWKIKTSLSLNSTEVITKPELVCKELILHQASGYIPKWCGFPPICTDQSQHYASGLELWHLRVPLPPLTKHALIFLLWVISILQCKYLFYILNCTVISY